jgi:hypothetical protein
MTQIAVMNTAVCSLTSSVTGPNMKRSVHTVKNVEVAINAQLKSTPS